MHRCLSSPSCFKIDQIPSSYSELPVRDPVTSDPSGCCRASAAEWCAAEQVVSVPRGSGERSRHARLHGPQQTLPLVQRWVPQIYAPHRCSSSPAAPELLHTQAWFTPSFIFICCLKGSYDAISSVPFSLECYKLFVHRWDSWSCKD